MTLLFLDSIGDEDFENFYSPRRMVSFGEKEESSEAKTLAQEEEDGSDESGSASKEEEDYPLRTIPSSPTLGNKRWEEIVKERSPPLCSITSLSTLSPTDQSLAGDLSHRRGREEDVKRDSQSETELSSSPVIGSPNSAGSEPRFVDDTSTYSSVQIA